MRHRASAGDGRQRVVRGRGSHHGAQDDAGSGPASVKQVTTTFESVIGKLKPVVETVARELGSLAKAPDLVEVEFAVKLSADAGVIIARAGSEASLRVKVGWKKAG